MKSHEEYRKLPRLLIAIFAIAVLMIITASYGYYERQKSLMNLRIQNELVAIASMKAAKISDWMDERFGDADIIKENSGIMALMKKELGGSASPEGRKLIVDWFRVFNSSGEYENIMFIDMTGSIKLAMRDGDTVGPVPLSTAREAHKSGRYILSDLYIGRDGSTIRQSMVVPVIDRESTHIGTIVMRINLEKSLYPILREWPSSSRTAESMLVRQEEGKLVYLDYKRKGHALTMKSPVIGEAIKVADAESGSALAEVVDYRGVSVLAAVKAIPRTGWLMLVKIDSNEVYAYVNQLFWIMILLVGLLVCATMVSVALVWRHQSARYYRTQYEAELGRVALLRHYEPLTRHANDSILLMDAEGNILEANERSVMMLGYPLEQLLHMNVKRIGTACALLDLDDLSRRLRQTEDSGIVYESEYARRDGSLIPVEVSLRAFEIEDRTFFQAIIRDITERKEGEARINAMNALLELYMRRATRREYLHSALHLFMLWSGCRCAGIRIIDEYGRLHYEAYEGFSREFWTAESWLSLEDHNCACIRVILERPENVEAGCMTSKGSFICNDLRAFVDGLSKEDREKYRGRCYSHGFRTMAVIPIRYQGEMLGLVHLADERPGKTSHKTVELIEAMSPLLGEAMCRFATEEALKLSEEHYRSLIESSNDCIFQLSFDGEFLSMNSKTADFLGIESSELIGRQIVSFISDRSEAMFRGIRKASNGETVSVRYRMAGKDGSAWWDASLSPVRDLEGLVISILGIARDISGQMKAEHELKRSHEKLRNLSVHLQTITEEERTNIAREVHDELGQVLTALKMETSWLAGRLAPEQPELITKSKSMLRLIDSVIAVVKRICTELRPTLLDHLGIGAALEWQMEEFRKRTDIECDLHVSVKSLDKEISTMLFRVFQESLTNIMRHANASKVKVSLKREGDEIVMRITDNGRGIKKEQMDKPQSFGLLGMRERVYHLGGQLTIRGIRNGGTSIKVSVPAAGREAKPVWN